MEMLVAQGPAETTAYFIAGYVIIFGVMLIYLASLMVRWRNQNEDLQILEEIEEQKK